MSSLALRRSQTGRGQTDVCLLIHSFVPSTRRVLDSSLLFGAGLLSLLPCSRGSAQAQGGQVICPKFQSKWVDSR